MPPLSDPNNLLWTLTVTSVFLLVLSVWIIGVLILKAKAEARQERIQRRLELLAHDAGGEGRILRLWSEGKEAITVVPGLTKAHVLGSLEAMRRTAGIDTPLPAVLLGVFGSAFMITAIAYGITGSILVSACGAVAVLMVAWIYVKQRIATRAALFESQLVDALDLAARSLRAGHPLQGAFRLITEEIPAPVGQVFADITQQHALGLGLDQAIRRAADASTSSDLKLFATSVIIQMRSGGSLADMMERLAFVIRDRMRLARRVRVLTAQTQFSKRVLLAMPFLIFVVLNVLNPGYMEPLYASTPGHWAMLYAGVSLIIGTWMMNRLAIIKY